MRRLQLVKGNSSRVIYLKRQHSATKQDKSVGSKCSEGLKDQSS